MQHSNRPLKFIVLLLVQSLIFYLLVALGVSQTVVRFFDTTRYSSSSGLKQRLGDEGDNETASTQVAEDLDKMFRNERITIEIKHRVAIVMVLVRNTNLTDYKLAIESVECYSRIQNYQFILANDTDFNCPHRDKFFRRHCVVAQLLPSFDTIMFLDADIGVVNPKRRIEEFMDDNIDIIFYDRFYNWEIAMGSYIVRNTVYARDLLRDFANYEKSLPQAFHGTDNGAIHLFLAKQIFSTSDIALQNCEKMYNNSNSYKDLFVYEACVRTLLGSSTDFGKIRIVKKGAGWVRDDWIDSGIWHPDLDFMLHGWKTKKMAQVPAGKIRARQMNKSKWYNPFAGPIVVEKCSPSNSTWEYDPKLIGDRFEILENHRILEENVARQQLDAMAKMAALLRWKPKSKTKGKKT